MKNYDGPAYFRLHGKKRPKSHNNKNEAAKKDYSHKSENAALQPISKIANSFANRVKKFEPKEHPKKPKEYSDNFFVRQSVSRTSFYAKLIKKLKVNTDDLILISYEDANDDISKIEEDEIVDPVGELEETNYIKNDLPTEVFIPQATNHINKSEENKVDLDDQDTYLKDHKDSAKDVIETVEDTSIESSISENKLVEEVKTDDSDFKEPDLVNPRNDEIFNKKAQYKFPPISLLSEPNQEDDDSLDNWIEHQIDVLNQTLEAFHIDAEVVDFTNGPTVTQFQIKLALGVKVNRITNLTDDLKLALAAKDIRIEAPIPGKSTVGIEIPNPNPRPVNLSEILNSKNFIDNASPLSTAVGVDISGNPRVTDIRKMPHGLIAGATGSGKSVFINSLLVSLLYKATPAELKLILIDPKAVELAPYDEIPHLLSPVISDPNEAAAALKWLTVEMDQRYEKLSAAGVRNIEQFNKLAEEKQEYGLKMPYILVIIDELADLMMVASSEVQDYIVRITQKARAAGIHLIVATQRPSVDIVTGTIKNNIPTRIAFMVSSQVDSRTILDSSGAERLLGRGDMLYLGNGDSQPTRLQGAYVTNQELENVVSFVKQQGKPHYQFTPDSLKQNIIQTKNTDELMPEVLDFISELDSISTSKLQRHFSIGYNRAANIIDDLENHNYISSQHGSKPREVYYREKSETND